VAGVGGSVDRTARLTHALGGEIGTVGRGLLSVLWMGVRRSAFDEVVGKTRSHDSPPVKTLLTPEGFALQALFPGRTGPGAIGLPASRRENGSEILAGDEPRA
jgi:hypothetical protein